jgi:hypothetical protein
MPDVMETTVAAPAPAPAPQGEPQRAPEREQPDAAPRQDDDSHDPQQDDAQPGDDKLSPEQRTIRKLERRIAVITARRGGAEREAQLLKQELSALRAAQQQPQADDERTGPPPISQDEFARLVRQQAAELRAAERISERVEQVMAKGATVPGFDDACNTLADEVPLAHNGTPTPFARALLDAENPVAVIQHLADNPGEAAQFTRLTPEQMGRRIARLESQLEQAARKQSNVPTPITPVKGSAASATPDPVKNPAAWREWRNKTARR